MIIKINTLRSKNVTKYMYINKSSSVAETGDCGHNRHGPKRGGGAVPLSRRAGNP